MRHRSEPTAAVLLMLIAAAGLGAAAASAEVSATPTQYLIMKAAKAPVIDGKLGEWDMAGTPYVISTEGNNPMVTLHSNDPANPVKGDKDFSGRAALAWDEKYLYIAGQMTDDHLLGVKPDSKGNQGPAGWSCDSLMLSVASYRQPLKTNSPYSATPFLGVRYAPTGANPRGGLAADEITLNKRDLYWILTAGSLWGCMETAEGYNVEAAVPWADLGYVARPGELLFMAFLAADVDPGEDLNQVGWASYTEQWGSGQQMNLRPFFRLADRSDALGMITVSKNEVPVGEAWTVRVEADALSAEAKLEKLRINDGRGRSVWEGKLSTTAPAGKSALEMVEIPGKALKSPGAYGLELQGRVGGKATVLARLPVTAVPGGVAAPPVVSQSEIHHMGGERVAHNAWAEHREGFYRHGWVKGREDYVAYIRSHAEPGLKATAKGAIDTKNPWGYRYAFRCMALYRITGDAEYQKLARDIMDYTVDTVGEGWGGFKSMSVAMYRYLTWLGDPKSPWAPPNAEARYRAALYPVAANPDKSFFTEWGTHNRTWSRYAKLKVARMVAEQDGKPVDPRVVEYTDWHDKKIGEVGDTDDASAGYHWVFFDAAIGIYFHTGDFDAFLKNKGFTKTLARYVEMVAPGGACPPFASCSGWPEVGASMWAYELMSRLTGEGRYRWTSQRIAEYYYNHLDYRANQYHGPYDTAIDNFVLGYLFAEEGVTPKAPPTQSRLTWRHPWLPATPEEKKARPGLSPMQMDSSTWIPDKVVLSSGNEATSLWGLVELLPIAGHGGELPGNIIAVTNWDAALFAGQGYYENTPEYQNLMWVEDLEGVPAGGEMKTTVPLFVEDPAYTFVRVVTENYQHMPVTYTRDILFYKNGFLLVKDRVKFNRTMKVRLGPCYHARNLGPQNGENWFNSYYDQIMYTGLGLGRGVQAIRNPAWDMLIYFTPRAGRSQTVVDRFEENRYRNSPVQMRQVWSGMPKAGEELTFTSVLLPHPPVFTPADLVNPPADSTEPKFIEVATDTDGVTVVKAIGENDPANKIRKVVWVMLNTTGQRAEGGPLASDGLLAMVEMDKTGKIVNRLVAGGSTLTFQGADESGAARKATPITPAVPAG